MKKIGETRKKWEVDWIWTQDCGNWILIKKNSKIKFEKHDKSERIENPNFDTEKGEKI